MQVKDQKAYDEYKAKNAPRGSSFDNYVAEILAYTERWAELMQKQVPEDKPLTREIMDSTSHEADTSGITGYMYGAAARAISTHWIRGDEFRALYNSQYGDQGEEATKQKATINPAIVTFVLKEDS